MKVLVTYDISDNGLRTAVFRFLNEKFRNSSDRLSESFQYNPRLVTSSRQRVVRFNQRSVILYLEEYELDSYELKHLKEQIDAVIDHSEFIIDNDKILCCQIGAPYGHPYGLLDWG